MPGAKPKLEPVPAGEPTTGTSFIEWSPQHRDAIEVAQANPGLCAVLENAALLYASGQAPAARALLEQGVETDHDARQSPLAWLALFDLVQRAGDREAFDRIALQYSVQFERSAPMWEGRDAPAAPRGGGYLTITGALTAASATQIETIRRAIAKRSSGAKLDLSKIASFDDEGARLLASALADARRAKLVLTIERSQKLQAALEAAVRSGREGGAGAWLLALEMLQWAHDQATFDERAIEYAVAFEMSPPSWEPPPQPIGDAPPAALVPDAGAKAADADGLALSGVLAGNNAPAIAEVQQFAHGRQLIALDMTTVERIDFVCAGALINAVNRIESQRKAVQVFGATPIIRALLLLIGLSPRHFVKKAV